MESVWKLIFDFRNIIAALPLVYAFFSVRWEFEVDYIIWPVAGLLCLAGAGIRAWARWHNTYAQGRRKHLATTGPYAFVRNPLYIGNILILAGADVASELQWLLPLVVGWAFIVYAAACKHEEQRLRTKYPVAYEEYANRVHAWWPRFSVTGETCTPTEGFGKIALLQVLYAFLWLMPFVVKEVNPLGAWPHP